MEVGGRLQGSCGGGGDGRNLSQEKERERERERKGEWVRMDDVMGSGVCEYLGI